MFENEELQTLYNDLIDLGSLSSIEALKVGAAIEELDIRDLLTFMDTDKADILAVYEMLLLGSRNHLRSFDSQSCLVEVSSVMNLPDLRKSLHIY